MALGGLLLGLAAAAGVTEAGAEWTSLFDGSGLAAWKVYGKPADTPIAWVIEDGALVWRKGGGSLVTREMFGDFELELEWKIAAGGNSGVMFGVDDTPDRPWHTGPEVQLLDDHGHRDGARPLTRCGALYALYPPARAAARAIGEWNVLRMRVQRGRVQAWLNAEEILDIQIGSDDWNARVAQSKFAPFSRFARVASGRILLQDHGDPVWFRSIRIRRL